MANAENREKTINGAGPSSRATKSGHSVNYLAHVNGGFGSSNEWKGLAENTVRRFHFFHPDQKKVDDARNKPNPFGDLALHRAPRPSFSNPYISNATMPTVDHARNPGTTPAAQGEIVEDQTDPKLIGTSSDMLSPDQVRYLLFQGHRNEHIARQFLNPNIGSNFAPQNEKIYYQLAPNAHVIDLRRSCIYCLQNIKNDTGIVPKLPCGHYFHTYCFHRQSEQVKNQHIRSDECRFCIIEKRLR